jgi:hypothetical protein
MSTGEFGYANPYTYGLIVCRSLRASIEMVTAVEGVVTSVFAPLVAAFAPLTAVALDPASGNPVVATRLAATSACGVTIAPGASARLAPKAPEPTKANRATEIKVVVKL